MDSSVRFQWSFVALGVALAGSALVLNSQLFAFRPAVESPAPTTATQALATDPAIFRTLSFGQLPMTLDWIWIRILEDPDISHVPKGAHPPLYYRLDLLSEIDPAFFPVYTAGAGMLAVIRDDGAGAKALLNKGKLFQASSLKTYPAEFQSRHWGKPWEIPLLSAYVNLFELDDLPSAALDFGTAAGFPDSPHYLQRLRERLAKPGGYYEVGEKLLMFLIESQKDRSIKSSLQIKLESLRVSRLVDEYQRRFDSFAGARKRTPAEWARFLKSANLPAVDPWGGTLELNEDGKVRTTTPHNVVFGLKQ